MAKKTKTFLTMGNGHQIVNRRRALEYVQNNIPGLAVLNNGTVKVDGYGTCHFAAYTNPHGAMISTPNGEDKIFGSADWHKCDNIMMFRDMGDGKRVIVYICPIEPLFGKRTIGHHGVAWDDVSKLAKYKTVFSLPQDA